jgi:hypothetical protein
MHLEALESRTFMSAAPHAVTVPLKDSAAGNLPAGQFEGTATHLGKFTATIDANLLVVFTAANGDQLWIQTLSLAPTSDPTVWHVEAQIVGGTGRFEGASGTGSHDVFFLDDQGNFVFSAETSMTLPRPWNAHA